MAGTGPAPAERRRRTNADVYADVRTTLAEDGQLRGPDLGPGEWYDETREWYETWRRSPQAAAFLTTDWQRLKMLAELVQAYYTRPHQLVMAEIRQNESLLGATHVDRLKARMKVERKPTNPAEVPEGVAVMDDYRAMLSG